MIKRYILGAGAHGRVVADILRSQGMLLDGFIDDDTSLLKMLVADCPVVGSWDVVRVVMKPGDTEIIVALGNAPLRLRLARQIQDNGFALLNAIHANAVISPAASLGKGICVCAGAVVNPGAVIGDAVIINTGATVDHDCIVGDGVHISPGVHLAGRVTIGSLSFLSTGISVAPRVQIGANSILGAGSVVVKDIPDGVLAYGVPARVIQKLDESFDWRKLL